MIEERRIAIDGKPVEKPATLLTSLNGVTVDGQPVKAPAPARLFRFHKPAGLLTAASDPKGRPTIYDRLPKELPRVMPVGRLDMNTEGLLLLTTDGELKRQLELPSSGVERTYRARAFGDVSQEQLEELIQGIEIDGIRYGPIDANLERRTGRNTWIEMRLTEGKNREVRRVLEHLGLQVSRLIRIAYGPFILGDLAPGEVEEIRQHDLVSFRKDPHNAPRNGEGDRAKRRGGPGTAHPRPERARRDRGADPGRADRANSGARAGTAPATHRAAFGIPPRNGEGGVAARQSGELPKAAEPDAGSVRRAKRGGGAGTAPGGERAKRGAGAGTGPSRGDRAKRDERSDPSRVDRTKSGSGAGTTPAARHPRAAASRPGSARPRTSPAGGTGKASGERPPAKPRSAPQPRRGPDGEARPQPGRPRRGGPGRPPFRGPK